MSQELVKFVVIPSLIVRLNKLMLNIDNCLLNYFSNICLIIIDQIICILYKK